MIKTEASSLFSALRYLNLYWDSCNQKEWNRSRPRAFRQWFDVWQWLSCLASSCNPWGLVSLFKSVYIVDVSIDWYCIKPLVIFIGHHVCWMSACARGQCRVEGDSRLER
jgi:hypothetical protein